MKDDCDDQRSSIFLYKTWFHDFLLIEGLLSERGFLSETFFLTFFLDKKSYSEGVPSGQKNQEQIPHMRDSTQATRHRVCSLLTRVSESILTSIKYYYSNFR